MEVPGGECGNVQTGGGDRVSTISLLGCSTSVALATGPTDEEGQPKLSSILEERRSHVQCGGTLKSQFRSVDKKNQPDINFCILYFSSNSCSTCFGQTCAHHQELTTA